MKNNVKYDAKDQGNKPDKTKNNSGRGSRKPKPKYKPRNKDKDENPKVDTSGDINNPAYYYEDANVLSQVMNFSFNEFGAVPIKMQMDESSTFSPEIDNSLVASYYINPSIPETGSGNAFVMDGVTTAGLRNFVTMSGGNAKTTNYAPQDVTMLILALAQLLAIITWCARALGIAYLFNYRNRTYPDTLLRAMCIDPDDFRSNLATYRVKFNTLLAVAARIPFPANIPIFAKATKWFGSLYMDDNNSALAQTYMFNPYTTWLFNETKDPNGSGLDTLVWCVPNVVTNFSLYLTRLESMISALLNSTTLNYIYSDVMRLVQVGKVSQLISFNSVPEDFVVAPVYDEEVETWLHNAFIIGAPLRTADQHYDPLVMSTALTDFNDVFSDAGNNKVFYHPQFKLPTSYECGYSGLIDFTHDNVTVEERVRATRFTQRWTTIKDGSNIYTNDLALNDAYIVEVACYNGIDLTGDHFNFSFIDANNETVSQLARDVDVLSKYDWFPQIYVTSQNASYLRSIGDLDYYTIVDYKLVKKMYDYEVMHFLQIS